MSDMSVTHQIPEKRKLHVSNFRVPRRDLYVIESPPCFVESAREKILQPLTAVEAANIQKENPELIVRLANEQDKANISDMVWE